MQVAIESESHPSWVRGLKSITYGTVRSGGQSHPSWVRGLKCRFCGSLIDGGLVAPFMGAWIEMPGSRAMG
ncbi:hypothetical protein, partial [Megasphaera elsdenii]|uniref:hypothetical protein n=1 Tax=Megasphaera elsdenii TaxID=907 RepID=UPI003F658C4F